MTKTKWMSGGSRPARITSVGITQYLLDALAWVLGFIVAEVLRYEFNWAAISWLGLSGAVLVIAAVQYFIGLGFHLYRGRYPYGSFEEVRALTGTVVTTAAILVIPLLLSAAALRVPRSTIFIATPIVLVLMLSIRYARRLLIERNRAPRQDAKPVLVYGAGEVGAQLVRALAHDTEARHRVVGLLDDDPDKRNLAVRRTRVLGTLEDLPRVARDTGAKRVVVAIARADAELMRRVHDLASGVGVKVKVLPPFNEILADASKTNNLRDISIEDLIGRQPVDTEVASIASYLTGKRVLVTGAGGSIGSELCRQIARFNPAELIMLDRDETGLQAAELMTLGHGLLDGNEVVLADIREPETLKRLFAERRPDVVFHAAALKHLPMLEQYPDEAWKTNVLGSLNVLQAAWAAGTTTFVNVSTDKAANPTSVLGHSKRLAEKLTAWAAEETGMRYLSVRFGNVIGSRGSMLPTFQSLIERGGPLTVTHPDITRYFMTIPEACQLVVQAGGIGRGGEVLILDMGEPVRILDIARRMIEMSGKEVDIVFTGLREGEKLHEELVGERELVDRPFHPKISHATVESISPDRLDITGWRDRMSARPRINDTTAIPRPEHPQSSPKTTTEATR